VKSRIMGLTICFALIAGAVGLVSLTSAQTSKMDLKIDNVMTPQEMKDSGVSNLTTQQLTALNTWLNRYTETVMKLAAGANTDSSKPPQSRTPTRTDCSPAIESAIKGTFKGWTGDTVFQLDNGQIWQQAEYDYTYSYAYHPDVTIYQTTGGCRMKVEDESETIIVRRIH
jgi:hypothetical protein